MNKSNLDLVFSALSDPTRRGMLARLAAGDSSIGELASDYAMSQPAISKHVRVLENAGLILRTKRGRQQIVQVDPRPIKAARAWIGRYARFWEAQFDAVEVYLADRTQESKNDGDQE